MLNGEGTGVSTYARALMAAIRRLSASPHLLTTNHDDDGPLRRWLGATPNCARLVSRSGFVEPGFVRLEGRDIFRRAHVHFSLRRRLLRLRSEPPFGIMHWTYPVPMVMEGWTNIYTVHDAIPLTRPDLTPISMRRHYQVLRAILARAHRLVTVSEAARFELVEALACDPAMVVNCGQPVDVKAGDVAALPNGVVAKGYLLYFGSIEPRKNLSALLKAHGASEVAMPLVIVGPAGWRAGPILKEIEAARSAVRLTYRTRDDLISLIRGARAVIFPSLAEGFGLPVVEAMALGAAVLTSNRGALAEVAGGAALLVDPDDAQALARQIKRIATDDALIRRLVGYGQMRAKAFSSETFVDRLLEVYRSGFADDAWRGYQQAP